MKDSATGEASEILFGFDELFFSRTDRAGLIQYGNDVFQRVSIYSWDELLGKPHKIVRHPDTPRAVFHQLWSTIQAGNPIGAYVKNRAKDGRYYWVYAIATPVEGGYLSVRLRPSSDMFALVKQEYASLVAAERRHKMSASESAEHLLERLGELGFTSYEAFMSAALRKEVASRDEKRGLAPDRSVQVFEHLSTAATVLLQQADVISIAYACSENVPFNFRVLAAQLGSDGAAIGVISGNYSLLSSEMKSVLDKFVTSARELNRTIAQGAFLSCTARIQREVAEHFRHSQGGEAAAAAETDLLDRQQREYSYRALAGLKEIARTAASFRGACTEMTKLAAGLEVTRIMGKVECSRHTQVGDRLGELLSDLETFQRTISAALKEIDVRNQLIEDRATALLSNARAA